MRELLQIFAVSFTFLGTLWISKGILTRGKGKIASITIPKHGQSSDVLDGMCGEKADYSVGLVVLLIGIISQIVSMIDIKTKRLEIEITISLIVLFMTFITMIYMSKRLYRKTLKEEKIESFKIYFHSIFIQYNEQRGFINERELEGIVNDARAYLNETPNQGESHLEFVNKLRKRYYPKNHDFTLENST